MATIDILETVAKNFLKTGFPAPMLREVHFDWERKRTGIIDISGRRGEVLRIVEIPQRLIVVFYKNSVKRFLEEGVSVEAAKELVLGTLQFFEEKADKRTQWGEILGQAVSFLKSIKEKCEEEKVPLTYLGMRVKDIRELGEYQSIASVRFTLRERKETKSLKSDLDTTFTSSLFETWVSMKWNLSIYRSSKDGMEIRDDEGGKTVILGKKATEKFSEVSLQKGYWVIEEVKS